jgi:tetratricopeptide (TPR) repeat protein
VTTGRGFIRKIAVLGAMWAVVSLAGAVDVRGEEDRLREELLSGMDLIYDCDIRGGEEAFDRIIDREPDNPAPYIYKAMAYLSMPPREEGGGFPTPDEKRVEALLITGTELALEYAWEDDDRGRGELLLATGFSLLAQLYQVQRRYLPAAEAALKAARHIDRAYVLSPDDPDVLYARGLLLYGLATMPDPARSLLSLLDMRGDRDEGLLLISRAADDGVYTASSARMSLLFVLVNMEHDFNRAIPHGMALVESYPNNPEIYFPYAYALSMAEDFDGALAVAAGLKDGIDRGLPYFDDAIVPRYHHLVGKIYMDMGEYDRAVAAFEEALTVTDINYEWVRALALVRMGMIADIRGDREAAVECYNRAIDEDIPGVGLELSKKFLETPYDGTNEFD